MDSERGRRARAREVDMRNKKHTVVQHDVELQNNRQC
jgi:hypothetical protein